jgi:hypothetical protein
MRGSTRLHAHEARFDFAKPIQDFCPRQSLLRGHLPCGVNGVNLKNSLGQIEADYANLFHWMAPFRLMVDCLQLLPLWHSDAAWKEPSTSSVEPKLGQNAGDGRRLLVGELNPNPLPNHFGNLIEAGRIVAEQRQEFVSFQDAIRPAEGEINLRSVVSARLVC